MKRTSTLAHGLLLGAVVTLLACRPTPEPQTGAAPAGSAASPAPSASASALSPEDAELGPKLPPLEKEDVVVGEGPEVKKGDHVLVHYTGTLTDGTKFDSSVDRGVPFDFVIGAGNVIAGWDLGVVGMKKGGKRKLTIPPHLGYGMRGAPPKIPPDATLKFDIELVEIQ